MLEDQSSIDAVIKLSYGTECSVDSLRHEMLSSVLAGDLGLPILEPYFVNISDDYTQSYDGDMEIRNRLINSSRLAFGVSHLGRSFARFDCGNYKPKDGDLNNFLRVFAFDAFIGNYDRYKENPNALIKGDDWFIIDHDIAFGMHRNIFPYAPWKLGSLNEFSVSPDKGNHIFFNYLKGKNLDFSGLRIEWCDISDERIAQYDAILPDLWIENREWFEKDLQHIKNVRDNIDGCISELERILS